MRSTQRREEQSLGQLGVNTYLRNLSSGDDDGQHWTMTGLGSGHATRQNGSLWGADDKVSNEHSSFPTSSSFFIPTANGSSEYSDA